MRLRAACLSLLFVASAPSAGSATEYAHVDHPIVTTNPAAQADFNRGLTLLYAFSRLASRHAFEAAAAADPKSPMPWWGVAMTYGGNINVPPDAAQEHLGAAAVKKALALASDANPTERDYVKALAVRYTTSAKPDFPGLAKAYHNAMRALAAKYPQDVDAATLYAESGMNLRPWDLYAPDGTPRPGTAEIVATLESALKLAQGHIGANHLLVHATEASSHPQRGLQAAGVLGSYTFEPAASHLTHMPAHTLARCGYFREASGSDVLATAADRTYLGSEGRDDQEQPEYYIHDLTFLAYTDGMDGDASRANQTAARAIKAGAFLPEVFVELRFGEWQQILALAKPKPFQYEPMREAFWRFARGMAYAADGNVVAAQRERVAFAKVAQGLHVPLVYGFNNSSDSLDRVAGDMLDAKIAAARHDSATELAKLQDAVKTQDAFAYIEPPDWYMPVREALGSALLRDGHAAQAAAVFRADLARNPRNPRSLYGLSRALTKSGDATGAAAAQKDFLSVWQQPAGAVGL